MDEINVARKAIQGEEEAFIALMHMHKEALLRTALAFLKNEHAALEALQETTYRAFKKIHTLKEPAYAKTWLIRIMINYCQDQLKRGKRFVLSEKNLDLPVLDNLAQIELQEALSTLSPTEQQLIYMKYFQDVKIKDIAAIEKIPEGTVKSRLHKTLRTLRRYLEDKGEIDHV
ncbi:sigma-70 family RNA polymerase sigma factor [Planococcus sp. ANT_H30]|uniref:RNA polymerase subunit sigma-24 n=1 Tax=Planococcus kocurii TaxID=1374 RepID=A0ABN4JZL5_9BACL|nr:MULTISPECIES: sigma-70 family RNA polymerase sigma factor [Planococcus]ALS80346.1 RNA polymerase subunit sigma-24 [Planococcus kocurii]KAA0956933.1 sigma-70 family RNA polymerase sigma factor [Planococcus sp. ANT_H30]